MTNQNKKNHNVQILKDSILLGIIFATFMSGCFLGVIINDMIDSPLLYFILFLITSFAYGIGFNFLFLSDRLIDRRIHNIVIEEDK
jgi:hypothetical protein